MYANTMKLSIISIMGLCLWCSSANAALVHYWPFDNPSPLVDEGQPYTANEGGTTSTWYPHAAQLADPCAAYTAPTITSCKFGEGYQTQTTQPPYSDVLVGGTNVAGNTAVDGTLPPPPLTLSMWFCPTYPSPSVGDLDYVFGNFYNSNNNDRFYLSFNWPNPQPAHNAGRFCFSLGTTKDAGKDVSSGTGWNPVSIGEWHHVMMTVVPTGSTCTVNVVTDGLWSNAQTVTGCVVSGPGFPWCFDRGNKRVGTNGNQIETGKTAIGKFDDVAIWNEALPLEQAAFICTGGPGGTSLPANVADGKRAYAPTPGDKSVGNSGIAQLKWYNAKKLTTTVTNDIYFSSSKSDLQDACNVPLFPAASKIASAVAGTNGAQSSCAISVPTGIDTFYWRVATKTTNPADGNNVNGYAGPIWTFAVSNAAPQVNAGADKYTYPGVGTVTLSGTVIDDGLPVGASVTCTWKQGSTPISTSVVKTGNSYACTATVAVGTVGSTTTYTLEGNDTTGTGSDTMDVKVYATPCTAAQADPSYLVNPADLNNDCFVNFKDFALSASKWKVCTALDATCN
jgi:hypothetical protein